VASDCILRHLTGFFDRAAIGDNPREGWHDQLKTTFNSSVLIGNYLWSLMLIRFRERESSRKIQVADSTVCACEIASTGGWNSYSPPAKL